MISNNKLAITTETLNEAEGMLPYLLHLGHNNYVVTNRIAKVLPVVPSQPLGIRRIRHEAKQEGKLINCSQGKAARAVIVLTSGHIVLTNKDPEIISRLISTSRDSQSNR
jgi:regulator of extracellular matrix RemA (YlzA/DUF370 family)